MLLEADQILPPANDGPSRTWVRELAHQFVIRQQLSAELLVKVPFYNYVWKHGVSKYYVIAHA